MIHVKNAEIQISEQLLHELLAAIEKAKEELVPFCDEPMPVGDMTTETYDKERAKRGFILISSPYCGVIYRVNWSVKQECLGYKAQI